MRRSSRGWRCEQLERRDAPAWFGRAWDDRQVTLSFVPDGADVDGAVNQLHTMMASAGIAETTWKIEILRAAQTWLQSADLTVGVVPDDGSPLQAAGAAQGDGRFGDIRISARPLSEYTLAVTTPPGSVAGSRAGEIIFNSNVTFSVGGSNPTYDLYSVALQEVGHALGIGNSGDVNSPMFGRYQGLRTGITSADRANIEALYGLRGPDAFDATLPNDSFSNASPIPAPAVLTPGSGNSLKTLGDVSTASDVDYYSFHVPAGSAPAIVINVQTSGLSLLQGRIAVFSDTQQLKGRTSAAGPLASDMSLPIYNVLPGQTYFICIDRAATSGGAIDTFAVGDYKLEINLNPAGPTLGGENLEDPILNDNHTDDSIATANELAAFGTGGSTFKLGGRFLDLADIDYYRLQIPDADSSNSGPNPEGGQESSSASVAVMPSTYVLEATIASQLPGDGLRPILKVSDSLGDVLPSQILRNGDGTFVLQVPDLTPGQVIYLFAEPSPSGAVRVGDYQLRAEVLSSTSTMDQAAAGFLSESARGASRKLTVYRSTVMHFVLELSESEDPSIEAGAFITLYNDAGVRVFSRFAKSNESVSGARYLPPGEYTLRVFGVTRCAQPLPTMQFGVRILDQSDPIGPEAQNPDAPVDDPYDLDELSGELGNDDPGEPEW